MKIYNNNINNIMESYKGTNINKPNVKKTNITDKVEISKEALDLKKYLEEHERSREEKIMKLKEMIDNGTYAVKSEDVADAILKGVLLNKKI
ncbi:MAG: flagellar biosynthesis anti-sigma factor FlgM [Thermoanaerobacteraceae bacterium]|jgi:negative regulator of flagellin synthesis FlgM|nr:flagellar biosynthesis anti-sigma factor FlgM [Thermoanaerobacteraceae bacterium]